MAYVKDMVIEDSEGNKYYNGLNPTKVIKNLNDNAAITEEGYTPDALVTKTLIQNLGDLLTPKILYDAAITAVGDVSLKSAINNYSLIIFCGSMVVNKEPSHFTTIIPASVLVNINSSTNCLIVGDTRISSSSNEYSGYIKVFMKNASVLSIAEINGKNSSSVQLYKVFGL